MDLVEVELVRIVIRQKADQQYIHLRERHGSRSFPIVIGFNEIDEINRKLHGFQTPRPLTHDLVGRVITAVGRRLARVVVNELRDDTFYAILVLAPVDAEGPEITVDCRPSDAIALAVQCKSPIHVARDVFEQVATE